MNIFGLFLEKDTSLNDFSNYRIMINDSIFTNGHVYHDGFDAGLINAFNYSHLFSDPDDLIDNSNNLRKIITEDILIKSRNVTISFSVDKFNEYGKLPLNKIWTDINPSTSHDWQDIDIIIRDTNEIFNEENYPHFTTQQLQIGKLYNI